MTQGESSSGPYLSIIAILLLITFSVSLTEANAQQAKRRQKQEKFGSSLKRLKWDSKRNQTVDKPIRETGIKRSSGGAEGEGDPVKLSTLLVIFDVLVTDKSGKHVSALTRDDFVVRDEGVAQQIESFSAGADSAVPRRVILLIDRSGSERAYIDQSVEAAESLIDQLGPNDEVALIDDNVDLIARYTGDKAMVKRALDRIKVGADLAVQRYAPESLGNPSSISASRKNPYEGRSLQFTALFAALRELMPNDGTLPIVIFQTDGDEAPTLRDQPEAGDFIWNMPNRNYGLADILRAAEHSKATIYSVIPSERLVAIPDTEVLLRGRDMLEQMERARFTSNDAYEEYIRNHPLSDAKVKLFTRRFVEGQQAAVRVAEVTGGWSAYLETPDQAGAVYSRILSDIKDRYVIGYYPVDSESNGRLHKVRIEVKGHPEYIVHGRDGYYAPGK